VAAEIVSTLKFGTFDQKAYGDVLQSENSDVIGTDADKDGVWDYIEAWINTTYAGKPNTITSLKMLAKEFQFKMLNYRDKEAIVNESHKAFGIDCLLKAEPEDGGDILDEFEAQMMNTAARTKAYLSADSQLGGQVFNMPSEATVTQECGF